LLFFNIAYLIFHFKEAEVCVSAETQKIDKMLTLVGKSLGLVNFAAQTQACNRDYIKALLHIEDGDHASQYHTNGKILLWRISGIELESRELAAEVALVMESADALPDYTQIFIIKNGQLPLHEPCLVTHNQLDWICGFSICLYNGEMIMTGGQLKNEWSPTGRCFQQFWGRLPDMLVPRSDHATVVFQGKLYAIGGVEQSWPRLLTRSVERWDGTTWELVAPLPRGLLRHGAFVSSGTLCVVGGWSDNDRGSSFVFLEKENTWLEVGRTLTKVEEGDLLLVHSDA
jgi:Kelch motif protein